MIGVLPSMANDLLVLSYTKNLSCMTHCSLHYARVPSFDICITNFSRPSQHQETSIPNYFKVVQE